MTDRIRSIRALVSGKVLPLCLALLLVCTPVAASATENYDIKQEVIDLVLNYHVSGVQLEDLDTESIETVIASLNDPYTEYLSSDRWQQFVDSMENNYIGIGIRVGSNEKGFFVIEVFQDTPAEKAGLLAGDYIVAVNGMKAEGMTLKELVGYITGTPGTSVTIAVDRSGETLELTVERSGIHVPPLTAELMEPGIGYVRVTSFSSDVDELFFEEMERLQEEGMKALILDLRNNPGGYLDSAGRMAALFVDDGVLIYARDRDGREQTYVMRNMNPLDIPVFILINEYSASASEVLAGSLQDHGVARLVGKTSYGKGSVQSLFHLSDGSVLKLTVQEYLTPKRRPVNLVGLEPDVVVHGDVPQLIAALQLAGEVNVNIKLDAESLTINGVPVLDRFSVIRENGRVYVPARVLAALVEGIATWDAETRSVLIRSAWVEAEYAVDSEGVLLRNGVSYIALNRFQTAFPSFAWIDEDGTVTLMEDGGK